MNTDTFTSADLEAVIKQFRLTEALATIRDARSVEVKASKWTDAENCYVIDCDKAAVMPELILDADRGKVMVVCSLDTEARMRQLVAEVRGAPRLGQHDSLEKP